MALINGSITSVATHADGIKVTTSASQSLAVGDIVALTGTNTYDNSYEIITIVSGTEFTVPAPFDATSTGTWIKNLNSFPSLTNIFKSIRFGKEGNNRAFESPLDGSIQTAQLTTGRWRASYRLKPLTREQAQAWIVFLVRLRGTNGRFYAHDPSNTAARGDVDLNNNLLLEDGFELLLEDESKLSLESLRTAPLIKGASQVGTVLETDNWRESVTGVLLQGDAISYDTGNPWRERNIVAEDVDSDNSGEASINLVYPMRENPLDNAKLITLNASCIMRLVSDGEAEWSVDNLNIFRIQFSAVEAFQ